MQSGDIASCMPYIQMQFLPYKCCSLLSVVVFCCCFFVVVVVFFNVVCKRESILRYLSCLLWLVIGDSSCSISSAIWSGIYTAHMMAVLVYLFTRYSEYSLWSRYWLLLMAKRPFSPKVDADWHPEPIHGLLISYNRTSIGYIMNWIIHDSGKQETNRITITWFWSRFDLNKVTAWFSKELDTHAYSFKHIKVLTSRVFHQSAQYLSFLLTLIKCMEILESK